MQVYAIYSTAINTFKETKDKTTKQYNKDLEEIELKIDELAKEINKQILIREQQQQKTDRTKEIHKLKLESEGILQDIRRIEQAVAIEDQFLNRKDIGLLDKALARRYQQKLVKHKRNLENRLSRRQQIIKGKGLPLDVTPDDELSDGGYSSLEEFKNRETLPHRYKIKRSRFRENFPSLFDYPNEIPKHHTVDRLAADEQEELNKRIVKEQQDQEQETKTKSKPKKAEISKQILPKLPVISDQKDPNLTPPHTPVRMPGNKDEEKTHYWSLRDIPKFEGKGEQPFSHLMEFEDYLIASGVRMQPDEDESGRRVDVDYKDIINKFKASLKNNARVWYSMYIDGRITDLYSEAGWKTIKSRFLTYFNPIGCTKEQQIKAWKELKWKPEEEKLTDFVFRFSQLAHELAYTDEQQIAHFVLCIPRGLYLYIEGAKTVPDAVENLRKGIALGGLDTFNSASKTLDDSKPSVPFMAVKDYRPQVTTEDTLRVVKESIHDLVYESSKSMIKQLDKIGDRLANVVEDFQKKQSSRSSRNRDRDRSNSRDRNDSRDRYRNNSRSRNRSRDRSRDKRDSRNNSRDRGRSNSRESRNNQQRSGSGQRYFDKKDFCDYCNRTGHPTHRCFKLENYLKRQGKRIVLYDDDDVQEIAQAVQDLNTKLNSLKLSNSTNN